MIFAEKVGLAHHPRAIHLKRPHIAPSGLRDNLLHRKGQTAAVVVTGEGVAAVGVFDQHADAALPTRRIPCGARLALGEDAVARRQFGGVSLQLLIGGVDRMKQRVGPLSGAHQPTIIAHPFGPPQRRRLHIVGCEDDGNADPLESAETHALVGTEDDGVGLEGDDALEVGTHRVAAVDNLSLRPIWQRQPSPDIADEDILRIAYADNAVGQSEVFEQLTMRGREHHHAAERFA